MPLALDEHGRDYTARIEAHVVDASDRAVTGAGSAQATYGRFLVAAETNRYVYSPGDAATVTAAASPPLPCPRGSPAPGAWSPAGAGEPAVAASINRASRLRPSSLWAVA